MRRSGFISKAACCGYRPSKFASYKGRQRTHLIARLVRERNVARFIVAPSGYGKTSLAIDYAETMFAWIHVFWINGSSPCFIRDLDNGIIAAGCLEADDNARLVVIDDLPQLDAERTQLLSDEIDSLIAHNCEVFVICTPSCDLLGSLQKDRLRLGAADLLMTDEEIDATRSDEERLRCSAALVPSSRRVPALAWGTDSNAAAAFVSSNFDEGFPADLLLIACSAYVLQQGTFADLSAISPIDPGRLEDIFDDYPHLGFDVGAGRFEAPPVDSEVLARAIRRLLDTMLTRSRFESKNELIWAWAGILLDSGSNASRACDIVRVLCPAPQRASWLVAHAHQLVRCCGFNAIVGLVQTLKGAKYESREFIRALEALCRRLLGDEEAALQCAKRCAFDVETPRDARIISLLVVVRVAVGELQARASSALLQWAESAPDETDAAFGWQDALAVAWAAKASGIDALAGEWQKLKDAGVDDDLLCQVASWLFGLAGDMQREGSSFDTGPLGKVEGFVRTCMAEDDAISTNFFIASAGLALEEAHTKGMVYAYGPMEAVHLYELRQVEVSRLAQVREYERSQRSRQVQQTAWPSMARAYTLGRAPLASAVQPAIPTLELRVFGRLDVAIGGVPIDLGSIGRRQTRILLVLLAANRGRDLSRESVAQSMWPAREPAVARKNFYTVWSQLRRGLSLPDGSCPYLVRHQYGCRLDERYVRSDIARFDDICRELLFGKPDFDEWIELYTEIERDFSGELLPIEEKSPLIIAVRESRRKRMVDALIAGSLRLIEVGNPQWAIWFARSAINREVTREDAYVALMRAQVAYDQRTAAMQTYFECRRMLAEELGIDPSPETNALYNDLLGEL